MLMVPIQWDRTEERRRSSSKCTIAHLYIPIIILNNVRWMMISCQVYNARARWLQSFTFVSLSLSLSLSLAFLSFSQLVHLSISLTIVCWSKKSIAFNVAHVRVDYLYHTHTQLTIWNGYSIDHRSHWRLCISASWCSLFFNSGQIVEPKKR